MVDRQESIYVEWGRKSDSWGGTMFKTRILEKMY